MSAEAWRAVLDRSTARGAELLALLVLADASPSRSGYVQSALPFSEWARMCRCCERQLKKTVASLVAAGRLFVIAKGGGRSANTYEIPVQIFPRGVSKACPLGVSITTPLVREDPLEQASRADLHCTGTPLPTGDLPTNVVRYPKFRRNDRTGT